jgi:ABC-type transport system involved in Fe-S cluster assembly fused permease/ATPase subunit
MAQEVIPMKLRIMAMILVWMMLLSPVCYAESGFTQEDRDRLIRLEATLQTFMQQVDKRFEQVDKRFEQMDKRIDDLREDMNKRFEQMMTFLWILAGIFTALVAAVIGFAYWDRRTIIRKAKEEAMEEMKKEGLLRSIIQVLKEMAPDNPKLAESLRKYNLL